MPIIKNLSRMWNAFRTYEERTMSYGGNVGMSSSARPHVPRTRFVNERTIIAAIYTRMAIDIAGIDFRHVKLDEKGRYLKDMDSSLNRCFNFSANLDQGPRAFRQDIVVSLFDEGVSVIVPVDTTIDPNTGEIVEIHNLRVGKVCDWYPRHVRVSLYNEATGLRQDIIVEKRNVAIIENPFYAVMNEPNSTLQRLIRKLSLLDVVDEQSSSGKLDLIIQLPYVVKTEARRQQADARRKDLEFQLKGSKYGIAYADGTEKITQLNRAAENNLLGQIEYLVKLLYSQLGITEEIMNGTASEEVMNNYYARTVEPIIESIKESMQVSFVGLDGWEDSERIMYFRNPFRFVSLAVFADIADRFSRNEIVAPNEFRQYLGIPPSDDPEADKLKNSNMPQPANVVPMAADMDAVMEEVFTGLKTDIEAQVKGLSNGGS